MGIFSRNRTVYNDFSMIGTDLHSHLLPGMDDGSPSLAESVKMLHLMADLGYRRMITTPHVISDLYPNTREQLLGQLHHLREVIREEQLPIEVEVSAEYHMDYEFLGKVQSGEVIPFGRKNYLLIELPFQSPSFSYNEIFYQVQLLKFEPVLSHPERYAWLMGSRKIWEGLKDRGILFQLNLNSLTGLYGLPAKLASHQLIDAGMIDFAGSDAHHSYHITELRKVLSNRYFDKLLQSGRLLNSSI
jgi:protein-tyrosine phosphatase